MARADIVLNLVKTGVRGDMELFRKTVKILVEEERAKNHYVLADQLTKILDAYSVTGQQSAAPVLKDAVYESIPQITLNDLVLSKSTSRQINEFIEEHQRKDLLRSYSLEPKNRILLYGEPGNGKTSLAEAVADSLALPFCKLHYEDVIQSYLGDSAKKMNQVFEYVSTRRCVLFLDEFETISKERADGQDLGEIKRLVSSLLMQIDRLPPHVILIAASNHRQLIDNAFWRRFQIHMEMKKPTRAMTKQWLESFCDNYNIDFGYSSNVISQKLGKISFSEIEAFAMDVMRRYVLNLPDENIKPVIDKKIIEWKKRIK